ncbi:MAG: hypothetical protein ACOVP4_13145 [Bacteriovoracaceae bacterium]
MRIIFLFLITILATQLWAHEVTLSGSYLEMQRRNETGRQAGVEGFIDLNSTQRIHLGGQYLERFDLYERIILVGFEQKFETFYLKADMELGHNGRILPHYRYSLGSGQSIFQGISFYEEFKTAKYTKTELNEFLFNVEIEKINSLVIIPMTRFGNANFIGPAGTQKLFSYGLKMMYYKEDLGQIWISGTKGQEPAQAVFGSFNEVIRSKSIATGVKYLWNSSISTSLSIDYTDYDLINNNFLTTNFNTTWSW